MKDKQKSFTLIELMVVIAIVGLIAAVALVAMRGTREKAKIAKGLEFDQSIFHSIGANVVGIWNFDNCTAQDASGYGNNGTIYGATCVSDTPHSIIGQGSGKNALSFDGNDYINILGDLGDPSAMTIEFWFYVASNYKTRTQYFMDGRNGGNWWFLQSYNPNGTGNINFYHRVKVDPADWSASQWNHLILTINSSKSAIYINGELKATGTGLNPDIGTNMRIATRYTGGAYFIGRMDEIRIYEIILPFAEIQKHYAEGLETHQNIAEK